LDTLAEQGRSYAQRYLRRVFYANSNEPVGPQRRGTDHRDPLEHLDRHYLLELLLDYGDLPASPEAAYLPAPTGQETTDRWPLRPDPFSSFRSGFEVRTLRLCRRVLMVHHFEELGGPTVVRALELGYTTEPNSRLSLLGTVAVKG